MNVETIVAIITAVASLTSLGSLGVLFKINSENKKTSAEAKKVQEEANDIAFERLLRLYDVTAKELDECKQAILDSKKKE